MIHLHIKEPFKTASQRLKIQIICVLFLAFSCFSGCSCTDSEPIILYGTYEPSDDTEIGMYAEETGICNKVKHPTIAGYDIGEAFSLSMVSSDFSIKLETTEFTSTNNGIVGTKLYYKDVYVANLCYSNIYDFT